MKFIYKRKEEHNGKHHITYVLINDIWEIDFIIENHSNIGITIATISGA